MAKQPPRVGDLRLVLQALGGIGAHLSLGSVQPLPGHGFLAGQLAVARQVRLGIVQQRACVRASSP